MTQDGHPVPGVAQAGHSTGPICRTCHRQPCQRPQGLVDRFDTRDKGNMALVRQKPLRHPRVPAHFAQQWLRDLAGVGRATRARAAAASEPVPRSNAMLWSYLSGQRSSRLIFRRVAVVRVIDVVRPGSHRCRMPQAGLELHLWTSPSHLRARRPNRSSRRRLDERNCNLADNHRSQVRTEWILHEKTRRQMLYRDFIEEAAKCYIDALQHDEADIPRPWSVFTQS